MSDTVICMTLFIMIMVCVWTYIDIDHMIPFIQEVAKSYSKESAEVDPSLSVNNKSLFIVQLAMIATYLVLGYQIPARLVLGAAGLGVGEKVFMLGFQVITEALGYKKAKESKGTSEDKASSNDTELQPVKEIDEPTKKVTDATPVEATEESEGTNSSSVEAPEKAEVTSADSPKSDTEKDESQSEDTKVADKETLKQQKSMQEMWSLQRWGIRSIRFYSG